jgi:two-component system nitrogen regulation response regulator NtrX
MPPRVLIVDDELNIGRSLQLIFEGAGYMAVHCRTAAEFRAHPDASRAAVVLLDVRLPDGNGVALLGEIVRARPHPQVVMISGHATIADAVEATRLGAFDFLEKPLARDRVLIAVKNALERAALERENERLQELAGPPERPIGASPAWLAAYEQALRAARSDARVLLQGETGAGKEVLAAAIHAASPFAAGPFVKVNCAAIPVELVESELFGHEKGAFTGATALRRGKFELADGGSLFLDEAGDLPAAAQAKLLRVLEEGEFHRVGGERPIRVTVRVLAATNRDLAALVRQGQFREDLYYRLSVVPLRVPALRERVADIRPLAEHFLRAFCERNNLRPKRLAAGTVALLEGYTWPGNIRELRNTVERMAILTPGDELGAASVPVELRAAPPAPLSDVRDQAEREHLRQALTACQWNVSAAARLLKMERTHLHKRIKALGLNPTDRAS